MNYEFFKNATKKEIIENFKIQIMQCMDENTNTLKLNQKIIQKIGNLEQSTIQKNSKNSNLRNLTENNFLELIILIYSSTSIKFIQLDLFNAINNLEISNFINLKHKLILIKTCFNICEDKKNKKITELYFLDNLKNKLQQLDDKIKELKGDDKNYSMINILEISEILCKVFGIYNFPKNFFTGDFVKTKGIFDLKNDLSKIFELIVYLELTDLKIIEEKNFIKTLENILCINNIDISCINQHFVLFFLIFFVYNEIINCFMTLKISNANISIKKIIKNIERIKKEGKSENKKTIETIEFYNKILMHLYKNLKLNDVEDFRLYNLKNSCIKNFIVFLLKDYVDCFINLCIGDIINDKSNNKTENNFMRENNIYLENKFANYVKHNYTLNLEEQNKNLQRSITNYDELKNLYTNKLQDILKISSFKTTKEIKKNYFDHLKNFNSDDELPVDMFIFKLVDRNIFFYYLMENLDKKIFMTNQYKILSENGNKEINKYIYNCMVIKILEKENLFMECINKKNIILNELIENYKFYNILSIYYKPVDNLDYEFKKIILKNYLKNKVIDKLYYKLKNYIKYYESHELSKDIKNKNLHENIAILFIINDNVTENTLKLIQNLKLQNKIINILTDLIIKSVENANFYKANEYLDKLIYVNKQSEIGNPNFLYYKFMKCITEINNDVNKNKNALNFYIYVLIKILDVFHKKFKQSNFVEVNSLVMQYCDEYEFLMIKNVCEKHKYNYKEIERLSYNKLIK